MSPLSLCSKVHLPPAPSPSHRGLPVNNLGEPSSPPSAPHLGLPAQPPTIGHHAFPEARAHCAISSPGHRAPSPLTKAPSRVGGGGLVALGCQARNALGSTRLGLRRKPQCPRSTRRAPRKRATRGGHGAEPHRPCELLRAIGVFSPRAGSGAGTTGASSEAILTAVGKCLCPHQANKTCFYNSPHPSRGLWRSRSPAWNAGAQSLRVLGSPCGRGGAPGGTVLPSFGIIPSV